MFVTTLGDASTDGSTDTSGVSTSSLVNLLQTGITAYDTQTIMQTNAARAAQGLPPLSPSAYAPTVNVGLDPNLLMYLGIGAVVLFMLSRN